MKSDEFSSRRSSAERAVVASFVGRCASIGIWSGLLLLLVNIAWSAWFAWGPRADALLRAAQMEETALVNRLDDHSLLDMAASKQSRLCSGYYVVSESSMQLPPGTGRPVRFGPEPAFLTEGIQRLQMIVEREAPEKGARSRAFAICTVGWPEPLLWCGWIRQTGPGFVWTLASSTGWPVEDLPLIVGRSGATTAQFPSALPLRPLRKGQVTYGAACVALVLIVRFLVRLLSIMRGRCRVCRYNLRGNTTGICPECGTPTKARYATRESAP